jgi:hypothetical protein
VASAVLATQARAKFARAVGVRRTDRPAPRRWYVAVRRQVS